MLLSIQPLWLDISDRVKSFTKSFETKQKLDKGGQWGGAGEGGGLVKPSQYQTKVAIIYLRNMISSNRGFFQ